VTPFSLVLVAALVTPAAPPASAPAKPQTFLPYAHIPGELELNIDPNSFALVDADPIPFVLVDIELILTTPVKMNESPVSVKSYQNSLEVDCTNDLVIVVRGRAFSTDGSLLYTSPKPVIVPNPHDGAAPTTAILNLVCPVLFDRYKSKGVTKIQFTNA
jgi:hypothetical protein